VMRIIYIQQHFSTGKGEGGIRSYNLVRTWVQRGHDVTVIAGTSWRDKSLQVDDRRWVHERDLDGFHLVQLGVFYSNHQGFLPRIRGFLLSPFPAPAEVWRGGAALVYASSTPLRVSIPAVFGRWFRGTPYVFEVRDLWPDLPIAMGIVRNPILKWLLYT